MSKRQPEKTGIARRKLLAGGVVLAGNAVSALRPQRLPALPTGSAAACAHMDEGTGRAVSQPAVWSTVPV